MIVQILNNYNIKTTFYYIVVIMNKNIDDDEFITVLHP